MRKLTSSRFSGAWNCMALPRVHHHRSGHVQSFQWVQELKRLRWRFSFAIQEFSSLPVVAALTSTSAIRGIGGALKKERLRPSSWIKASTSSRVFELPCRGARFTDASGHPSQKPDVAAREIEYLLLPSDDVLAHEPPRKLRIVAQDRSKYGHMFPRRNLSVVTDVNRVCGRKHDALGLRAHLRYGSYQQCVVGQS